MIYLDKLSASSFDAGMLEFFTDMLGRYRLIWGLVLLGVNLILLFFVGVVWFWLWAIAIIIFFSAFFGEF